MSASSFKDQGNKFLQAGDYDSAIAAYTQAIAIDPSDHVFFSNRSAAYLSKGDAANALKDGSKCIDINPSWAKGYSRKGAALHALKKWDEAINAYEDGLKVAPSDAALKSGLQEVQKAKDNSEIPRSSPMGSGLLSPQFLQKLVVHPKFGPRMSDPVFMKKLSMIQTNPQLLMSDPELMEVFQVMLGGLNDGGEKDEEEYRAPPASTPAPKKEPEKPAVVELSPAMAAKEKGNALYKAKKFEEAIAAYNEAIALDSTNMMFLNNKAAVYIGK